MSAICAWPAADGDIQERQIAPLLLQFAAAGWLRAVNLEGEDCQLHAGLLTLQTGVVSAAATSLLR